MQIREIRVEEVKPRGEARKEVGVQRLKIVAITTCGNRYAAIFIRARDRKKGKNTIRARETFRNGESFDQNGHIWIPQEIFNQMSRRAAAVILG